MKNSSRLEEALYWRILAAGFPEPVRQYRLPGSKRKFVFDFAWPEKRLLIEVQGGIWVSGTGHTSGRGITRDCQKVNEATRLGYRTLLITGEMVSQSEIIGLIEEILLSP